jgi:hypothetical protein
LVVYLYDWGGQWQKGRLWCTWLGSGDTLIRKIGSEGANLWTGSHYFGLTLNACVATYVIQFSCFFNPILLQIFLLSHITCILVLKFFFGIRSVWLTKRLCPLFINYRYPLCPKHMHRHMNYITSVTLIIPLLHDICKRLMLPSLIYSLKGDLIYSQLLNFDGLVFITLMARPTKTAMYVCGNIYIYTFFKCLSLYLNALEAFNINIIITFEYLQQPRF